MGLARTLALPVSALALPPLLVLPTMLAPVSPAR
jgi:hypothetical protein